MKKPILFIFIVLWPSYSLHSFPGQNQEIKPPLQRPDVSTIVERLLKHANNERMKRNLIPLTSSPDLSSLALRHSRDMTSHKKLSHLSTTGQSYIERLVDAGFYFIKIGENVAMSETFRDDIIHQKLMASPEHRENILDPDFDRIGIGIVYEEKKYYITQDYLQSLNIFGIDEAEKKIKNEINTLRLKNSLPPMMFSEEANSKAQSFSSKRAKGQPLPNLGNIFGETHIRFITFPSLHVAESISKELTNTIYGMAGVGVWFGRLKEYPGGTYVITLFLFPQSMYKNMNEKDLVRIALEAINTKRKEQGLLPLKLDKMLSKQASHISEELKRRSHQSNIFPAFGDTRRQEILSYVTEDLYVLPPELEKKIANQTLKKIGLGISSQKGEQNQKNTFWITLIF